MSYFEPTFAADVLRLLLLYKHGGVWLDYDAVPLRSFGPLLRTGLQFVGRFHSVDRLERLLAMVRAPAQRAMQTYKEVNQDVNNHVLHLHRSQPHQITVSAASARARGSEFFTNH